MNRDEFIEAFYHVLERTIDLSMKARREGLLALEDMLDIEKADNRDIFEYGLRFVIDGTDREIIYDILFNIINQEKNENIRLIKKIQLEAILSMQAGDNPRITAYKLNSFTEIPLGDSRFQKLLENNSLL